MTALARARRARLVLADPQLQAQAQAITTEIMADLQVALTHVRGERARQRLVERTCELQAQRIRTLYEAAAKVGPVQ